MQKFKIAGIIVALGIVFGDIGTSPLYVLKAVVGDGLIDPKVILGALSCVFWTLTLQTTVEYVLLALQADNKGEGGIFSLYTLIRRHRRWLVYPAMIGGAFLLADGLITPPISVSAAIEGLRFISPNIPTVPIVIGILILIFAFQQTGTQVIGRYFGKIMLIWFSMLGIFGLISLVSDFSVLKAFNPYYAYHLLVLYPSGFWILGAVFLCTTGAEALFADLGHCGRENIRTAWVFVKLALLLNYFGQGAYLISHAGVPISESGNPFFAILPDWFIVPGIILATLATIIASQSLISGSFTLIGEAMRLNLWPRIKIRYPTEEKGQLYIPSINWLLAIGCIGIVLGLRESSNMEAAYGLAITVTMIMTTLLLTVYLYKIAHVSRKLAIFHAIFFFTIEGAFLVANIRKIAHGGWITLTISGVIFSTMWLWRRAGQIKNRYTVFTELPQYYPLFKGLVKDKVVAKYATHLVYLSKAKYPDQIEEKIIHSIFRKHPKRADTYWLVHVATVDEPYTQEYSVRALIPGVLFRVNFRLGFRVDPKISLLFRRVLDDLVESKEVDIRSRYPSLRKHDLRGDFNFVILERVFSADQGFSTFDQFVMNVYALLRWLALSERKAFGLDTSLVTEEKVPGSSVAPRVIGLQRMPLQ